MLLTINIIVGLNEEVMWKFLAILLIAGGVLGCANPEVDESTISNKQVVQHISNEDVITIAKEYLNERNVSYADTRIKTEWHADAWWVVFSSQIPKPGGDFVVLVSHQGSVVEIVPGE